MTSEASRTGQRYIHHRERGSSVHLFFRASKEPDGDLGAPAYLYAGPATYANHSGERPMRILWKLGYELPCRRLPRSPRRGQLAHVRHIIDVFRRSKLAENPFDAGSRRPDDAWTSAPSLDRATS